MGYLSNDYRLRDEAIKQKEYNSVLPTIGRGISDVAQKLPSFNDIKETILPSKKPWENMSAMEKVGPINKTSNMLGDGTGTITQSPDKVYTPGYFDNSTGKNVAPVVNLNASNPELAKKDALFNFIGNALSSVPNTLSNLVTGLVNSGGDFLSSLGQDKKPIDRIAAGGKLALSAASVLIPEWATFQTALNASPDFIKKPVDNVFEFLGSGGVKASNILLDNLPISDEDKDKIRPIANETGGFISQVIALKFLHAGAKKGAELKGEYDTSKMYQEQANAQINKFSDTKITEKSTPEEIKKAYYEYAQNTHPDKGGNAQDFSAGADAYKFLTNRKLFEKENPYLFSTPSENATPVISGLIPQDVEKSRAEFQQIVKQLPEGHSDILIHAVEKPFDIERIKTLSPEERQVMGIALNTAKELPGADIANIESNIQAIENTGVKVPMTPQQEIKSKESKTTTDLFGKEIAKPQEEKVQGTLNVKPQMQEGKVLSSEEFKANEAQKLVAKKEGQKTIEKESPLIQEAPFKKADGYVNGDSVVAEMADGKRISGTFKVEQHSGGKGGGGFKTFIESQDGKRYTLGKTESDVKILGKSQPLQEKPATRREKQIERANKKEYTPEWLKNKKEKSIKKQEKDSISEDAFNSQAGAEVYQQLQMAEAGKRIALTRQSAEGPSETVGMVAQKSSFPTWIPENLRKRKLFNQIVEHLNNGTKPTKGKSLMELYDVVEERMNDLHENNNLMNLSDKRTEELLSEKESVEILREIESETNPNIRGVLQFKLLKNIMSKAGLEFSTLGQFSKDDMAIRMARNMSKREFKAVLRHEIRHAAFELMSPSQKKAVVAWYKSLSQEDLVKVFGTKAILDEYLTTYKGNEMQMADEALNHSFTANKKIDGIFQRILNFIAQKFKIILNKLSPTARVQGLYVDVFKQTGGETFKRSSGFMQELKAKGFEPGLIKIVRSKGEMTEGMASIKEKKSLEERTLEKINEKLTEPIKNIEVSREITPAGNINSKEVFKSAWRKLYGDEAPGTLADLLIRPADSEVIVKGNKISFESGKKVGTAIAQEKSREEKVVIREKNAEKIKKIRTDLRIMFKEKTAKTQAIKAKAVEYVKANLPQEKQFHYLTAIKNVKTARNLEKIIDMVDARRAKYERNKVVQSINEVGNNIKNLPIDLQRTIIGITSQLELKGHTSKTIERLMKTQEYLDRQANDFEMPRRVLNELGILKRTPLSELSSEQLIEINNRLQQYALVGKNIMKDKLVLEKKEFENNLLELEKGSVNLDHSDPDDKLNNFDKHNLSDPEGTKSLTLKERAKGKIKDLQTIDADTYQRMRLSWMTTDRLFNRLDGRADYTGINYRTFKEPINANWNTWRYSANKIVMPTNIMLNTLKMTAENAERINIYAHNLQRGGREKMIEDNKLTEKQIDSIVLTEKEMAVYRWMRNQYDAIHEILSEHMAKEENIILGKPENFWPMMTDFGVTKPIVEELQQLSRMKAVAFGNIKERQENAHQVLKLDDGFQTFFSYMDKATYYMAMNPTIKKLTRLAESDKYAESVGQNAQKAVLTWLDVLAKKGGSTTKEAQWLNKINDFNNNLSVAMLGLKISSTLKQPIALLNGAAFIGPQYTTIGTYNLVSNYDKWNQFMNENSSEIRERFEDPFLEEVSHDKFMAKVKHYALYPLQQLDTLTARAVWIGAYTKKMDELGLDSQTITEEGKSGGILLNKDALKYADLQVRLSQATAAFKDLPVMMTGKNRQGAKLIMKFQMFVMNDFNTLSEDLPDKWKKDKKSAATLLTWMSLAFLATGAVTSLNAMVWGTGLKNAKDKKAWWQNMIGTIASNTIQTIPFIGQMYSSISYNNPQPVPVIAAGERIASSLINVINAKKVPTKEKHALRLLSYTLGTVFGLPTDQIRQIIERMVFPPAGLKSNF